MRAVWYERTGPAAEVLRYGELPDPEPGPGEVRVRVAWSGVNPSDVKRREGWRGQAMAFPRQVPHSDGSGTVDRVGGGVPAGRLGERVWLHNAARGRPIGTATELCVVPAELAVPLPEGIGLAEAACLGVPAMTAHRAVFADGPVAGATVLVTGGAGAVGFYAVQLAKWGGAARVVATVSSPEKAAIARGAGADATIDYRREDLATRLRGLAPEGLDRVVEVDLGANLAAVLPALKQGGAICAYASMADPEPRLPFYALMLKNARIGTVFVYDMPEEAKSRARIEVTRWLAAGRSRHLVAARFPLDRAAAAHEAVEAGAAVGNVLLEVAGEG